MAPTEPQNPGLPLEGIRVVEVSRVVAGPTCGMVLGDLGAEVIKIESPGSYERSFSKNAPVIFTALNRNKKDLAVDLKSEEGKDVFSRLIRRTDVVVENLGPGAMERLGLSYESLRSLNPRVIYCSIKGYGPGPYQRRHAYDVSVEAESGLMYMTGQKGKPMRMGASVVDMMSGVFGVVGIILALRKREMTGEGASIESDLFETALFLESYLLAEAFHTGEPPLPLNTPGLWYAIYDVFDTQDGRKIFLGVTSDSHWVRFCNEFGLQALLQDERFSTPAKRLQERPHIIPLVKEIFANLPASELSRRLQSCGVVACEVKNPADLIHDPHLAVPGKLLDTKLVGDSKSIKTPAIPLLMSGFADSVRLHPPALGETTDEILLELGYSREQISRLREKGLVTG